MRARRAARAADVRDLPRQRGQGPTVFRYELQHLGDFFGELGGKSYLFWVIGAVAAFSITFRRIQAARVMAQQAGAYGAAPAGAPFGTAQPYGAAAPGQAPYPPQPQAPYGQQPPQPGHGPGSQPGPNPPAGPDPYGQNPGQPPYGQQYPPG